MVGYPPLCSKPSCKQPQCFTSENDQLLSRYGKKSVKGQARENVPFEVARRKLGKAHEENNVLTPTWWRECEDIALISYYVPT